MYELLILIDGYAISRATTGESHKTLYYYQIIILRTVKALSIRISVGLSCVD